MELTDELLEEACRYEYHAWFDRLVSEDFRIQYRKEVRDVAEHKTYKGMYYHAQAVAYIRGALRTSKETTEKRL